MIFCENCGRQLEAEQKYCDGCGTFVGRDLPPVRQSAPPIFAPVTANTISNRERHLHYNNVDERNTQNKYNGSSAIQKGVKSNNMLSQMGIGETGSKILNVLGTIAKYFWRFIKWGVKWGIRNT